MEQWLSDDCNLLQMNTYSSWLGQKGNRLVHSAKYKNIWTFNCLRQQMFFCSIRRRRQRRQRERQKSNRFILAKQQLSRASRTCITLSRHCTTTTWKCLISRFVEEVNTRQRLSFSFPELWYRLLQFNSRKIYQHLTNWTTWIKHDKVWSTANSLKERRKSSLLFKWCFRCRRSLLLKLPNENKNCNLSNEGKLNKNVFRCQISRFAVLRIVSKC